MASGGSVPDETTIPGAMPERWETAVEDIAQLVALGLDRAQDLADVIAEINRTKPGLTKAAAAGLGGAVMGVFIAGRIPRRRPSAAKRARRAAAAMRRVAMERASVVEQAAVVAQAAAQRLAERAPSPADIRGRLPRVDRSAVEDRASAVPDEVQRPRSAASTGLSYLPKAGVLFPIVLNLLRNPLVRALLWQSVARVARRR